MSSQPCFRFPRARSASLAAVALLALAGCAKSDSKADPESQGEGECKEDADCDAAKPRCNVGKEICVECIIDSQCAEGEVCDAYECVQVGVCADDDDCPLGQRCDRERNLCADAPGEDTLTPETGDERTTDDANDSEQNSSDGGDSPGNTSDDGNTQSTQEEPPSDETDASGESNEEGPETQTGPGDDGSSSDQDTAMDDDAESTVDDSSATSTAPVDTNEGPSDEELTEQDPTDEQPVFPEGTPLVLLLIDASSGVFSIDFDHGGSPSFGEFADVWEGMRHALSVFSEHSDISYWPMTYAGEQTGTCPEVDGPAAPIDASELASFLPPNTAAAGATKREGPLADALQVAYAELDAVDHEGPKHVLLLTDGAPGDTCTHFDAPLCGTDGVYGAAQDAYGLGIRTAIINFGGANGAVFAENVAHAGAGRLVLPAPETELYCLFTEAEARGAMIANATEFYEGAYRDYTLADYAVDGYVYPDDLADDPSDGAEVQAAVEAYVTFVLEN